MAGESILHQVESGVLDFETAFLNIVRTDRSAHRGDRGELTVVRNFRDEVVLVPVDEAFPESRLLTERPLSRLLPLVEVALLEGEVRGPLRLSPPGSVSAKRVLAAPVKRAPEGVVTFTTPFESVALVTLRDEANRNMFSEALMRGVLEVFAQIREDDAHKVVVIEGYGQWFCSGGTPETLAEIRAGGASFMDSTFFRALLDCPVPTIAALQGHALGGGLTFGLYADLMVMSESSYYAANFMEHGFTPGVGATYLFPLRFGRVLGTEMMWTARRYKGRELRERGAPMEIVATDAVVERALALARQIASKEALGLKRLKAHLVERITGDLPGVFEREQAMHDAVFARHRRDQGKGE